MKNLSFADLKSVEERRFVASVVSRNFPLVEVGRLVPGHAIANVSFSGIKKLNDRFGQEFVDHLLAASKASLRSSFDRSSAAAAGHGRVVRDDYKNLTVSLPSGADPVKSLFGKAKTGGDFTDSVIAACRAEIASVAKSLRIPESEVASAVRAEFGLSLGISRVPETGGDAAKLAAFREAELASKTPPSHGRLAASPFSGADTLRLAKEALSIEAALVARWKGKRFSLGGTEYPAVVEFRGEYRVSPELLRTVRKKGSDADIEPKTLVADAKRYLDALNSGFDFISPVRGPSDFVAAGKIEAAIRSGSVPKEAFLTTFKGALTKEAFFAKTEGRDGVRIFADIKDMGLMNFASFREAAKNVVRSGNGNDPSVLRAGSDVTAAFADTVAEIRRRFPGSEIAL